MTGSVSFAEMLESEDGVMMSAVAVEVTDKRGPFTEARRLVPETGIHICMSYNRLIPTKHEAPLYRPLVLINRVATWPTITH